MHTILLSFYTYFVIRPCSMKLKSDIQLLFTDTHTHNKLLKYTLYLNVNNPRQPTNYIFYTIHEYRCASGRDEMNL